MFQVIPLCNKNMTDYYYIRDLIIKLFSNKAHGCILQLTETNNKV